MQFAQMRLNVLLFIWGLGSLGVPMAEGQMSADKSPLSVLIFHSMFPSHFKSLLALGAELSSRGHDVTMVGPTVEGFEHLARSTEDFNIKYIETSKISGNLLKSFGDASKHDGNAFVWLYNMIDFFKNFSDNSYNYLRKVKDIVDGLNATEYDYIISEQASMSLLYYVHKEWETDNIMLVMTIVGPSPSYMHSWPFPKLLSPFRDNMTFIERLINTMIYGPLEQIMYSLSGMIFFPDDEFKPPFDDFALINFYQPILFNTARGILQWPSSVLPLQHYVGPMLTPEQSKLDQSLLEWLSKASDKVIYISMGTLAELTKDTAAAILKLCEKYNVIWSLRDTNYNILEGLPINRSSLYLTSWASQFMTLQEPKVALAILHCGLNGVQEALYNAVPVLCIPIGADQYDIASKIEQQGFGLYITENQITLENLENTVDKILDSDYYLHNVRNARLTFIEAGGVKRGADLVELYADVGYDHGVPSFMKYKWNILQFYNIDVWIVLTTVFIGLCCCCCSFFCKCF
jgi:glucuronosyltransferase